MKSIAWNTKDFKIELAQNTDNNAVLQITTQSGGTVLHKPITLNEIKGIREVFWDFEHLIERTFEEKQEFGNGVLMTMDGPLPEPQYYNPQNKFNWSEFIKSLKAGGITTRDRQPWEDAIFYAESRQTTPINNLSDHIPLHESGWPEDEKLRELGANFMDAVKERDIDGMEKTLRDIQERGEEIVRKKLGKEVSNG